MEASREAPRRSSSGSRSSPEFEFCPSFPAQLDLLTADELFVDGVLLPLHHLSLSQPATDSGALQTPPEPDPKPPPPPPLSLDSSLPSSPPALRWKDIFKMGERRLEERERRRERRGSAGGAAELNINIWPFARSRSAGNAGISSGSRAKVAAAAGRQASSAPCSRSNSRGESSKPTNTAAAAAAAAVTAATSTGSSSSRRWAPYSGRSGFSGGIHLGRATPVWVLRRHNKLHCPESKEKAGGDGGGVSKNQCSESKEKAGGNGGGSSNKQCSESKEKAGGGNGGGSKKGTGGAAGRVLNLNVNTCIGYRNPVRCRGDQKNVVAGGDRSGDVDGGGGNGSLFSLRNMFSKKVY